MNLTRDDAVLIDFGLSVLSPRWTTEILINLANGPRRTTQLLRDLKGVSAKTLCQRLRRLSELNIVTRKTFAEVPPRVEYDLTEEGHSLAYLLSQIKDLGERLNRIDKSRINVDTVEDTTEMSFTPAQLDAAV
ncbi:MAG: helix-turn-helix transcriptional regulator [Cyanobacteria bacterium SZAS LIN-2]|nr:helix-turn-helix transcriptional regulator [Cyanobacteria bacterium SZAS LIN-3]MBS1998491.1 helix-turn-helix transcriptional regulator [Cyanobacteria bacterium SZAS LIN-2]MBS2008112.1 helix-turn-helix transcriptional regulator [Cyanobacteria bacterium SZAS TMP-1]